MPGNRPLRWLAVSPKSKVRKKATKHRDPRAQSRQAAVEASRRSTRRLWSLAVVVLVAITVFGLFAVVGGGDDDTDVDTGAPTTVAPGTDTPTTPTTAATSATSVGERRPPASLPTPAKGASVTGDTPCPAPDGSSARTTSFAKAPPTCIVAAKTYVAEMQTSKGLVTLTLDATAAPQAVNNFVVLARYHYFDTLPFHRIATGFVIQGGSPDATGSGSPGYKFADELVKAGAYKFGSLAMANSGPNTNGSQFFIVLSDAARLQPLYSPFGQVTGGADVVKAIEAAGTPEVATDPTSGKPTEVVTIQTVTIKET